MNTVYHDAQPNATTMPAASPDFPSQRIALRKIGRATFIVSSRFSEDNGFTPYEFISDDGYSGADWDRLKLGFLTEILFRQYDVRYIAIHDNTDSEREDDIAPS